MKQALIIGINKYKTQALHGCVNDAKAVASILRNNDDKDKSVNFEVKLATDVKSKAVLRGMIRNLFDRDADVALLFFSGHGYIDNGGGYLVTPDGVANDPGISMDEILNCANQSDIKSKIIILDCCNAGAFGVPANSFGVSHLRKGITILTSSREKELSKERNGHGVFTSLLIDALAGGAADLMGNVTPGSTYAHIDRAIGNWGQRPTFRTNITRFTTLRKVKPSIEPEILKRITSYFPKPDYIFHLNPSFEWTNKKVANVKNTKIFKDLQSMNRVGLLIPKGASPNHMYFAAMQSKSCHLTSLGQHYWHLAKNNHISELYSI
jgi:hypothetical protein